VITQTIAQGQVVEALLVGAQSKLGRRQLLLVFPVHFVPAMLGDLGRELHCIIPPAPAFMINEPDPFGLDRLAQVSRQPSRPHEPEYAEKPVGRT